MGPGLLVVARALPHGRLRQLPRRRGPRSRPRVLRRGEVRASTEAQAALRPGQLLPDQPEHSAELEASVKATAARPGRLQAHPSADLAALRPRSVQPRAAAHQGRPRGSGPEAPAPAVTAQMKPTAHRGLPPKVT